MRVRLLGAYHDFELEFFYPKVFSYTFQAGALNSGHGDWRYDEFRLSDDGHLVHEIQWCREAHEPTWLIHADDVVFTSRAAG